MQSHADLQALFAAPRDDLLRELGAIGHEAFPRDPVTRGRDVYDALRASLQARICASETVRMLASDENRHPEVLAALFDLIAPSVHTVPAATLAVLLVRDGLPRYCESRWEEDQ